VNLEIITPEKSIYKGTIQSIRVPGRKGSFQILKDHAPLISTLGKGLVSINTYDKQMLEYEIDGGVIEVKANTIMLLAESILNQPV
jgi:F-type H+-transporting ATPase subunit epsilon